MASYNPIEKNIAKFLSKFPGIKGNIKKTYQFLNYLIYKKDYSYKSNKEIEKISYKNEESFFGYYDKSPINISNKFTIFQSIANYNTLKLPSKKYFVNIILYNNHTKKYQIIDKSYAYNWQQGTKLQWLDEDRFIYNVFEDNKYKTKIYNINECKTEKTIDLPIYDCYKDKYALTVNFDRLNKLRPDYGYRNNNKFDLNQLSHKEDGVFYIDLTTGQNKLLISLDLLSNFNKKSTMDNSKHKVNHIMISPNGENFIFLHRWINSSGQRFDRLIVSDINCKNMRILADDDIVSHCCWYGNETIIGYLRDKKLGDKFYSIDINTQKKKILSEKLKGFGDGHPSIYNNKMLFDSYPDKSRMKHLYIYDIIKDQIIELGEFYESLKFYGETRCDLHPKWSMDGKSIFIDSVHTGKRYLHKINEPDSKRIKYGTSMLLQFK